MDTTYINITECFDALRDMCIDAISWAMSHGVSLRTMHVSFFELSIGCLVLWIIISNLPPFREQESEEE